MAIIITSTITTIRTTEAVEEAAIRTTRATRSDDAGTALATGATTSGAPGQSMAVAGDDSGTHGWSTNRANASYGQTTSKAPSTFGQFGRDLENRAVENRTVWEWEIIYHKSKVIEFSGQLRKSMRCIN
jgi:hypothetical protein